MQGPHAAGGTRLLAAHQAQHVLDELLVAHRRPQRQQAKGDDARPLVRILGLSLRRGTPPAAQSAQSDGRATRNTPTAQMRRRTRTHQLLVERHVDRAVRPRLAVIQLLAHVQQHRRRAKQRVQRSRVAARRDCGGGGLRRHRFDARGAQLAVDLRPQPDAAEVLLGERLVARRARARACASAWHARRERVGCAPRLQLLLPVRQLGLLVVKVEEELLSRIRRLLDALAARRCAGQRRGPASARAALRRVTRARAAGAAARRKTRAREAHSTARQL